MAYTAPEELQQEVLEAFGSAGSGDFMADIIFDSVLLSKWQWLAPDDESGMQQINQGIEELKNCHIKIIGTPLSSSSATGQLWHGITLPLFTNCPFTPSNSPTKEKAFQQYGTETDGFYVVETKQAFEQLIKKHPQIEFGGKYQAFLEGLKTTRLLAFNMETCQVVT